MPDVLASPTVQTIAEQLTSRGETVAVTESSTAGLISASLLAVPGASAYYRGGSVVYTLESRKQLLGISRADVEGLEPLTEAMVLRFAHVARKQLDTTWAVAELEQQLDDLLRLVVRLTSGAPSGRTGVMDARWW